MSLKILIVDDDFINRKLLQVLLKKNTSVIEVIEAENGSDALDKLKKNPSIDLILLDVMKPIVDGVQFLKIFRSSEENSHIAVIVLSTDDTRRTEVLANGANDFIRKPVKEGILFKKIAQWASN